MEHVKKQQQKRVLKNLNPKKKKICTIYKICGKSIKKKKYWIQNLNLLILPDSCNGMSRFMFKTI